VLVELLLLRVQELMVVIQHLDLSLPQVVEQEQEVQLCFRALPVDLVVEPIHLIHLAQLGVVAHLRRQVIPIGLLSEMPVVSVASQLSQMHKWVEAAAVQAVQASQS
jgi:hypothetical protein